MALVPVSFADTGRPNTALDSRIAQAVSSSSFRRAGYLSFPVHGRVSSGFGWRFDPYLHYWHLHTGIDFAVWCGTPVHAPAAGRVIRTVPASRSGGFGNQMFIDHGRARGVHLTTVYDHLSRFVRTSGYVSRGQVVAYSGNTGFSTGCHLHFETRQNGIPVNPWNWL